MLRIKNLHSKIDGTEILKGLNLEINPGEIHAIMGPNGSGKSTLAKTIAGHPAYQITDGSIYYGEKLLNVLDPDERSHLGIFLAFQYPLEIPGVTNEDFIRFAYNAKMKFEGKEEVDPINFLKLLLEKMQLVGMNQKFLARNVNEGFSGGEKKKNEILQMALLDSSLGILDETDSGLDIDALKVISIALNKIFNQDKSFLLITHYNRILEYIKPDFVHIMVNGKIVKTGGADLALDLEKKGYEEVI